MTASGTPPADPPIAESIAESIVESGGESTGRGTEELHEEEVLGKAYDARLIVRLWPFIWPYRTQVILTLLMVVPLFAVELIPAWIVKSGLDTTFSSLGVEAAVSPEPTRPFLQALNRLVQPPEGISPWPWFAGLYFLAAVSMAFLRFCHMLLMATTGQAAMRDLRRIAFDHIQRLHMGFFDRFPVGRLVTRVTNDIENVAEMFSAGIVALITDVLMMVGIVVMLFLVSPKLATMTLLVVPFLAVAAIIFRLKVREAFRAVRVRIARINTHIQESITGMKVVQLFTREERNLADFDAMNADHRDAWKQSIRYDAALFAAVEATEGITIAVIIWYGTGMAEPGILYVFIDWMRRFFMPLRDLSAKYSVMQSSMASSERIFQLLDTEPGVRDPEGIVLPADAIAEERLGPRGAVEFQNVWFAYQPGDWVLKDVSFRVEAGEKVAFVGATGAGKTTIMNLLTRLYDVDRGRVCLDGVDIREMRQADLRRRVATVLQDVFLFSGTVEENISLGRPDVTTQDVVHAAELVWADRFIRNLPDGYATPVRERGSNFSAGQRQLLSFSRALASPSDVLILDEATSSIDTETEALIQHGIHVLMEGRTAIAIAHRLSTIRDVDRIYVLHQGRLVESGSHDELLEKGGVYDRLYRLQAESQERGTDESASTAHQSG